MILHMVRQAEIPLPPVYMTKDGMDIGVSYVCLERWLDKNMTREHASRIIGEEGEDELARLIYKNQSAIEAEKANLKWRNTI